jgi:hypothetical protein
MWLIWLKSRLSHVSCITLHIFWYANSWAVFEQLFKTFNNNMGFWLRTCPQMVSMIYCTQTHTRTHTHTLALAHTHSHTRAHSHIHPHTHEIENVHISGMYICEYTIMRVSCSDADHACYIRYKTYYVFVRSWCYRCVHGKVAVQNRSSDTMAACGTNFYFSTLGIFRNL